MHTHTHAHTRTHAHMHKRNAGEDPTELTSTEGGSTTGSCTMTARYLQSIELQHAACNMQHTQHATHTTCNTHTMQHATHTHNMQHAAYNMQGVSTSTMALGRHGTAVRTAAEGLQGGTTGLSMSTLMRAANPKPQPEPEPQPKRARSNANKPVLDQTEKR
jgi:hypothetical protein